VVKHLSGEVTVLALKSEIVELWSVLCTETAMFSHCYGCELLLHCF